MTAFLSVSSVSFHLFLVCTCEVNLVLVSSLHPVDIVKKKYFDYYCFAVVKCSRAFLWYLLQGLVSQAGKLNRFDLVQQISFLACQFQRGAARQVEGQEKSEKIFTFVKKVKIKVKMKMKLSILQHPLLCQVSLGYPKKMATEFQGRCWETRFLDYFGTSRLFWTAWAILGHFGPLLPP